MIEIKHRLGSLCIKATDDGSGTFEGYGSVFGNMDSYGDIVVRGAFSNFLNNNAPSTVKLLWQHDTEKPIGVYEDIYEDDNGLFVRGRLLINDVEKAREAYALLKAGAIEGLSIGYSVNPDGARIGSDGNRYLTDLKLWEISIVTFPANTQAQVGSVKKAESILTIRDFERFLRDAGFSQSKAKAIAADGFKAISQRDVDTDVADLVKSITNLTSTMKEVS